VSEEGAPPQDEGSDEIRAELERVTAERNRLEAEVEKLEAPKRHRLRRVLAPILVALAVLVFTITVPAAWGERTVLNTDRYVATIEPLADDPAVQRSIATRLTDAVFAALNVQEVISNALSAIGERATLLSAPLTNAIHGFVEDQVLKVVQSDAFKTFWVEANRFVHTQVLAVLKGASDTVSVVDGKVLLNLVPLVNLALASIERVSSDLVGGQVTLPTFQPGEEPSAEIAKLEAALGIDLPDTYGQVVVYDSTDLEPIQKALYWSERILILLLILIPILVAAALVVSTRRRRTLIQLTAGGAIGLVIVRRVAIIGRDSLFDRVNTQRHPGVRVLTDTLMDSLFRYTGILLAIVLLTLVIALITGPYPWAVATRTWVRDAGRGIAGAIRGEHVDETGRVAWLRGHRDGLMLGGGVVALFCLFVFDLSLIGFAILTIVLVLYELAIYGIGHQPEPEEPGEAPA
jgi:TRAP-type C4-dicarboxylate transport system permease small subunit